MTLVAMKKFKHKNFQNSEIYGKKITLTGAQNSDAIIVPVHPVSEISIYQTGSADIYITNYSFTDIENDTAEWVLYDGVSELNKSLTGVKAENSSGTTEIQVTASRGF